MIQRQLLNVSKALSDEARLRLLREVTRNGEISCGEPARRFPVAQTTVSHHLKILEEAGLVATRSERQFHCFRTAPTALAAHREGLGEAFPLAASGG